MLVDRTIQAWIKTDEGLKLEPYLDSTGHLTIGWGRNLREGIRPDEAELMFQNDLKETIRDLLEQHWFGGLTESAKNALINMNFNLGITKLLEFKELIKALEDKNYREAARQVLDKLMG